MSDLPDIFGAVTAQDRFWAKVDKIGPVHPQLGTRCWIWTAARSSRGYGQIRFGGKLVYAHRYSYELATGMFWPMVSEVDHRCHNPACVNPQHLRSASHKANLEHRRGANRNSSSGVRGVYWHKAANRWTAETKHNCHKIYLGLFDTIAEADAAIIAKRCELFTHNDADR